MANAGHAACEVPCVYGVAALRNIPEAEVCYAMCRKTMPAGGGVIFGVFLNPIGQTQNAPMTSVWFHVLHYRRRVVRLIY